MDPRHKQRRIPTVLAFVLLAFGVGVTMLIVQRGTFIVSEATPDYSPQDVRISNIEEDSFTISFVTQDPTVGAIKLNAGGEEKYILNKLSENEEVDTHYFEVEGLSSDTTYSYVIVTNQEEYVSEDYTATTAPAFGVTPPENSPTQGSILLPEGGVAKGAIVYLKISDSQLLSTVADELGRYSFDFARGIRTEDLKGYFVLEEGDVLEVEAALGILSTQAQTFYASELPPITLSRNYDFTSTDAAITYSSESASLPLPTPGGGRGGFSVITPAEGDFLIDAQPEIGGTGSPNTRVFLQIKPSEVQDNVVVNELGRWNYRVENPLRQGENTLTAIGVDSDGISRSVTVAFQVFPSGSQITESATPSATPTITLAPSPTPTLTPTPTAEPTPSVPVGGEEMTPTPTPTSSPTPTPSPTPWITVTPTPPGNLGGVVLTFASLLFIVTGATLLFILG